MDDKLVYIFTLMLFFIKPYKMNQKELSQHHFIGDNNSIASIKFWAKILLKEYLGKKNR